MLSLISWNMHQSKASWDVVLSSCVDAALLQEAKPPPLSVRGQMVMDCEGDWLPPGEHWRAAVVGLSDRIEFAPIRTQPLGGRDPDALTVSRFGTVAPAVIRILKTGEEVTIVSVYSKWEKALLRTGSSWIYADGSAHRVLSDLSALIGHQRGHKLIVAGDLSILYGYGEHGSPYWKERYATVFDRMSTLGLRLVGPQAPTGGKQALPWPSELPPASRNVPTFRTNRVKPETATRQLDFVFASESIVDRVTVRAANGLDEWGPSDHCRLYVFLQEDGRQ